MKLPLQSQIRFMRCFGGIEPGLTEYCSANHYLRAPFSLMRAYAQQSNLVGFSGFSHVLQVAKTRNLTKVAKTIVQFVAIYMVNMLRRPFTGDIRPRQSVRELFSVMDSDGPITSRLRRSSTFAYKIRSLFMLAPCKGSRCGVVIQRRPQMFNRAWWVNCHDNALTIGGVK